MDDTTSLKLTGKMINLELSRSNDDDCQMQGHDGDASASLYLT